MSSEPNAAHQAGQRAAKNATVRAIGEIVGKFGSLALFFVLAREVGDDRFGIFVFALAWGEVAMTPVGLGIDQFLLRQVAEDRTRLDDYFLNAITLKAVRGVVVVLGSILLVYLLDYSHEVEQTVSIITAGLLFDTMARTFQNVFNAFERGELVALSIVAQRMIAAVAGIALLFLGFGIVAVACAYSLGAVIRLVVSAELLRKRLRWPQMIQPADVRREIRARSLTFTTADLFGLVLARADVLLLAALAADAAVGQYGAAYRLFEATTFINVALVGAFNAMYTYLGDDTDPTLSAVFQRSVKICLALLLPIAVVLGLLAEPLCRAFYGDDFGAAAVPLRMLAPVVVLFGIMVLCSVLVLSRETPRRMVYTVAVAATVNIVLNLVFIPIYEDGGAAFAMLVSMVVYVAIAFRLALLEVKRIEWASMLAAPVLAAVAMTVPLLVLGSIWPVAMFAGVVVYLAVYAAVDRVVEPADFRFVVDLVRSRLPGPLRKTETREA